jgi:hypothetical protein
MVFLFLFPLFLSLLLNIDNLDIDRIKQPRIERTDTTIFLASFVKKLEKQSSASGSQRGSQNEGTTTPQRKDSTENAPFRKNSTETNPTLTQRKDSTDAGSQTPENASVSNEMNSIKTPPSNTNVILTSTITTKTNTEKSN